MPDRRLLMLGAALLAVCALYLTLGARGSWGFVLSYRGARLAALLIVGAAIAVSSSSTPWSSRMYRGLGASRSASSVRSMSVVSTPITTGVAAGSWGARSRKRSSVWSRP